MLFLQRAPGRPARVGIFPGAFNPPTVAHLALAHSALSLVDEVVFVLPRAFPHKPYEGAPFEARVEMLRRAIAAASVVPDLSAAPNPSAAVSSCSAAPNSSVSALNASADADSSAAAPNPSAPAPNFSVVPNFSAAVSEAGLFRDIAAECRMVYGENTQLSFLCGRDAAERILTWDYGDETSVTEMLREFDLLVAARRGEMEAPLHLRHAIHRLHLSDDLDWVSSSEVRERIARGEPWEHLVPEAVRQLAAGIYRPGNP